MSELRALCAVIQATIEDLPPYSASDYYAALQAREQAQPALPLLPRPCGSCAVECGFYRDYSNDLRQESPDTQLAVAQHWFCHEVPERACRGNANNLGLSW